MRATVNGSCGLVLARHREPDAGLEVNADRRPRGDVVDGLQIGHAVQEGIRLRPRAAIGNRAEIVRERHRLVGEVQLQHVVGRVGGVDRPRHLGRRRRAVGPEDRVEALSRERAGEGRQRPERRRQGDRHGSGNGGGMRGSPEHAIDLVDGEVCGPVEGAGKRLGFVHGAFLSMAASATVDAGALPGRRSGLINRLSVSGHATRTRKMAVASPGSARRRNFLKPIAISSVALSARRPSRGWSVSPCAKQRIVRGVQK